MLSKWPFSPPRRFCSDWCKPGIAALLCRVQLGEPRGQNGYNAIGPVMLTPRAGSDEMVLSFRENGVYLPSQ